MGYLSQFFQIVFNNQEGEIIKSRKLLTKVFKGIKIHL